MYIQGESHYFVQPQVWCFEKMLLRNPESAEDTFYSVSVLSSAFEKKNLLRSPSHSENESSALVKLSDVIFWVLLQLRWWCSCLSWKICHWVFSCTGLAVQGGCCRVLFLHFCLLIEAQESSDSKFGEHWGWRSKLWWNVYKLLPV